MIFGEKQVNLNENMGAVKCFHFMFLQRERGCWVAGCFLAIERRLALVGETP